MKTSLVVAVACAACGPSSTNNVAGDAGPIGGDGGGGGGGVDEVTCKEHLFVVANANGTRTEQRTFFLVTDVALGEPFAVELCDRVFEQIPPPPPSTCPAGSTCTDSGEPLPAGAECSWTSDGRFVAGKLVIDCGFSIENLDANGNTATRTVSRFNKVRLHR